MAHLPRVGWLLHEEKAELEGSTFSVVLEVGLEPTKPKGGRFTVSCDCHYTIPAYWIVTTHSQLRRAHFVALGDAKNGAASRIRTVDLLFTKQLL